MTSHHSYRAGSDAALVERRLDDLVLLYHRPSGQTHMVVSPVPEILNALHAVPGATAAQVRARLARDFDLDEEGEADAAIALHLEDMARLGLVTRP
ncbi:MAG: HPr-rel-A system PqqD family peptide chaperone [Sphingobium sp.]